MSPASGEPPQGHLPTSHGSAPVPAYGCVVYVSTDAQGQVNARVANLAGIACSAENQRAALAKVVAAFKAKLSQLHASGTPIPWIEPPEPIAEGESRFFIPVHL